MNKLIKLCVSLLVSSASILFASVGVDPLDVKRANVARAVNAAKDRQSVRGEASVGYDAIVTEEQNARNKMEQLLYAQVVLVPLGQGKISGNLDSYYRATEEKAVQENMGFMRGSARGEDRVDAESFLLKRKGNNRAEQNVFVHEGVRYLRLTRNAWLPGNGHYNLYVDCTYDNDSTSSIVKSANLYTVEAVGRTPVSCNYLVLNGLRHVVLDGLNLNVTKTWKNLSMYD